MNVSKKRRNDDLILIADQALNETGVLFKNGSPGVILDSYNGQIAALPVSVAMSGLLPTLAIYYQDKSENRSKVNRRAILTVIARMISEDAGNGLAYKDAEALYRGIISLYENLWKAKADEKEIGDLKKAVKAVNALVIECSIALKQVVRTYQLEKS